MASAALLACLMFAAVCKPRADALATTTAASRLRDLCSAPRTNASSPAIAVPGVHDALSAKIFAGYASEAEVLFLSGFGVSAARLGEPDAGILTLSEMEDATRNVVRSAGNVPVIVDGDTGYGGPGNVRRTVRGLAAAGAAAITIEDQVFPKRCTYAAGGAVRVVSREESVARIRAALAARDEARNIDGTDVLIVARTDCRAALGLDEAIERCLAYEALGADIVYAENLQSREEYVKLRRSLGGDTATVLAQVQQEPTRVCDDDGENENMYTVQEVGDMGYTFALFGVTALQATVRALQEVADDLVKLGVLGDKAAMLAPFSEVKQVVDFEDLNKFEAQFHGDP